MGKSYLTNKKQFKNLNSAGFTIVELLVVIVVIGILAAITIASYDGITQRAVTASLQSDLTNASQQLEMYKVTYGSYPTVLALGGSNCPSAPTVDTNYCLKLSSDNNFYSYSSIGSAFALVEKTTDGTAKYQITDNSTPTNYTDKWYSGVTGVTDTTLVGKYIYKTDLVGTYKYKTSNSAVELQFGIGNHLVNPQLNPSVNFSAYPAQNACKAIGGRSPSFDELNAIFKDPATYGDNFQAGSYWSSDFFNPSFVYYANSGEINSAYGTSYRTNSYHVRCVAD